MVAFHFQFANQTAWKCDECRKAGLEGKRHCAWAGGEAGGRMVWGRREMAVTRCPKSIITAESICLLDEFNVWKRCGGPVHAMPARVAEAILILDNELRTEMARAEQEKYGQANRR